MTKDEAIKILQTEMECVQRADCDRLACAYCDLAMREEDVLTAYQMALTALQTDGDCISRQAAIELAMQYCPDDDGTCSKADEDIRNLLDELEALPSAQPDIIFCRECQYGEQDNDGWWYCRSFGCQVGKEDGSGFCADAERRTDD